MVKRLSKKILAHRDKPIPSLGEVQPSVTEQLEAVFRKMVAKKIEDRYQTMTDVVAALGQCSAGQQQSVSIRKSVDTNADTDKVKVSLVRPVLLQPIVPAPTVEVVYTASPVHNVLASIGNTGHSRPRGHCETPS